MIHEYYMNRHKGISLVVIPSDEMAFFKWRSLTETEMKLNMKNMVP